MDTIVDTVALQNGIQALYGFPDGTSGKEYACQCRRHRRCRFDLWVRKIPLEEKMETHSSILAWTIPMDRGA